MSFGDVLAELRQDKGLYQKQLGELLNVSTSTISNYETNTHLPDYKTIVRIADYFEVSIDYLFGRTNFEFNYTTLNSIINNDMTTGDLINIIMNFDEKNLYSLLDYLELLQLRQNDHPQYNKSFSYAIV